MKRYRKISNLWRHPNGMYYVRWYDNGKSQMRSIGTIDRIKAKRWKRQFDRRLLAGRITPIAVGTSIKLFGFVDEFLNYIEKSKADSTYIPYRVALDKAKDFWGNVLISHITKRHMDILVWQGRA